MLVAPGYLAALGWPLMAERTITSSPLAPGMAPYKDEVLLGDDFHHAQVLHGASIGTHVTGHGLILPDATRSLAHTDRTDTAMEHRTVGGGTASHTETFHDALEAFALGDATDVNELTFGEGRYGDNVANFERGGSRRANFAEQPRRDIKSSLFGVTLFTSGGVFGFLGRETDLNCVITVFFNGFNLDHWAGSGFNDGDGDQDVLSVVDLRHPEFFA